MFSTVMLAPVHVLSRPGAVRASAVQGLKDNMPVLNF